MLSPEDQGSLWLENIYFEDQKYNSNSSSNAKVESLSSVKRGFKLACV